MNFLHTQSYCTCVSGLKQASFQMSLLKISSSHQWNKQLVPKRWMATNNRTDVQNLKVGRAEAVNTSTGWVLHFRIESPTHREWLIAGAAVIGWLQLHGTLPSWLTEAVLVVCGETKCNSHSFLRDETSQSRWSRYSLFSCVKTQRKWNGDGTCGRWQLQSAPWSSRWSTWRCSPSAPCCCPRSGCGPGSPQSARGNSATRWRQSPPGQMEKSFNNAGDTKINKQWILHEVRQLIFVLLLAHSITLAGCKKIFSNAVHFI